MKRKGLTYFGWLWMVVLMLGFTSCEVEVDDDFFDDDSIGQVYYNRSRDLCSRTWVDDYRDRDGNHCYQEVDFFLDRTGIDYLEVRYPDGCVEKSEVRFRWNWDNFHQTSIRMDYGHGDVSYLDEVYVGGNRLSGYLNGRNNFVDYEGIR